MRFDKMDVKKILLISLIAVAIVASVSAVSAGLFDGLFGEEQKDNVIEIEDITFNTTNATDFVKTEDKSFYNGDIKAFYSDNGTGSSFVGIADFSKMNDDEISQLNQMLLELRKMPSQTIDGIIVYTQSGTTGDDVGKPLYNTVIRNDDIQKLVVLESADANETAKMALSLKFK